VEAANDAGQRLQQIAGAYDAVSAAVGLATEGKPWPETTRGAVAAARRAYGDRFGEPLSRVHVRVFQRAFDWEEGALEDPPRLIRQVAVDLETGLVTESP
jgi:hypothetical protein